MEELVGLAQYGTTGIALAMIIVLLFVVNKMFEMNKAYQNLMGENLKNLTEAFNGNTKVLEENNKTMAKVLGAIEDFQDVIKNCKYNCK